MSLIDEALKRAQAAQPGAAKESASRPWAPPPLPDSGVMRRKRVVRALAGGLAAILVAAAVLLLLRRGSSEKKGADPEQAARSEATPAVRGGAALSEITSEVFVAPPPRGERKAAHPRTLTSRPAPQPAAEASRGTAAPANPLRPAVEEKTVQSPPQVRTYAGEAALPGGGKIVLEGIVFSEENPTALVNGRVLSQGGFVEGYEIVRIRQDRVELRGDAGNIVIALK